MAKDHTLDFSKPHRLGKRAFLLFLDKRLILPSSILLITLLIWIFELQTTSPEYAYYAGLAVKYGFLLFAVVFAIKLVATIFEYLGYSYQFDEEFFQVNRGYFARREDALAYHQIQNVNIKRGLIFRMLGLSQLIIVMSRSSSNKGEVDIVLPALDKRRAKLVQREIMHRARRHFYREQQAETREHTQPKRAEPVEEEPDDDEELSR